ncbi:MAG: nicotinamide-nucleotide amidohydrolase family protein [Wenzhouxiangella sp.]|nr:nicotinamide-nucleotide amidohydrolase family protein [Wenzhouxiangella sp.]TVR92362.1 MAG: nicotinamide-nucleotide amidohydrolase family protein [Wenzhouxiangellaceae bacterium]
MSPGLVNDDALAMLTAAVAAELKAHGHRLVTAESCTGGWIAKLCTDLAGSSLWFERGMVSYSNEAKQELLGVPASMIKRFGAVSEEVVAAMARGALDHSHADFAVAVSGIAGPGGGSPDKPVGTVCFGWALPGEIVETEIHLLAGDREAVRRATVARALQGLLIRMATAVG